MEEIYEFLNENADFGYNMYVGNENHIYMNLTYEDAMEYLEGKEVEVDYIEPDSSAIQLIVNDEEVWMIAI